jgi:hypothetical protein
MASSFVQANSNRLIVIRNTPTVQARRGRSANCLSGPGGAGASGAGTRQLLGVG